MICHNYEMGIKFHIPLKSRQSGGIEMVKFLINCTLG